MEDIACAAVVASASLSGLAALACGVWTDLVTAQSTALALGAASLLASGLAAVGRRGLAARAITALQSAMRPALAASIVASTVMACFVVLLAMPLAAAAILAAGLVVGAAASGLLANRVLRSRWASIRLRRNVAIYGASPDALALFNAIANDADASFAGLYDDRAAGNRVEKVGLPINGLLSDLAERIAVIRSRSAWSRDFRPES